MAQSHRDEELDRPRPCPAAAETGFHPQHLDELLSDRDRRVEVGAWILEHRSDARPADGLPVAIAEGRDIRSLEKDAAARDPDPRGKDAENGSAGERLAAAGLA